MKRNVFKNTQVYIMLASVINILRIILSTDFSSLTLIGAVSKLLSLAAPLSLVIYLTFKHSDFEYKQYIMPIGFGLSTVTVFIAGWQAAALSIYDEVYGTVNIIMIAVQAVSIILMFVGTLFDFENINYLKFGSLLFIGAATASIAAGIIFSKIKGAYGFNPLLLLEFLITILYYFGVYLFAKENRNKKEGSP